MDSGQLDVFHHRRHKGVGTVADRIRLAFQSMIQETVNENRTIRRHAHSRIHILSHALVIIDHFHAPSSQHIGGTNHDGITDPPRNGKGILHICRHSGFRHGNLQLFHHCTEQIPILRKVNDRRSGSQNLYPVLFQLRCQIERRLSAELGNHA